MTSRPSHRQVRRALLVLAGALCTQSVRAEPAVDTGPSSTRSKVTSVPTPLDGAGVDLVEAFSGYNLFFYGGAVAATGVMAFGGVDHAIRVGVQQNLAAPTYADTAFYAGYIVPAISAPVVYLVGLATHDPKTTGAGSAALQALGVTLVATGVLKVATGRAYPLNGADPSAPDRLDHPEYAHLFHPFQRFWPLAAWPSGHTSATISIAAALTAYYPDQLWIPFAGYPLALAIGYGMMVGDRHWASDVVAGALLGHAIGYSVGRSFRLRAAGARVAAAKTIGIVPLAGTGLGGVAVAGCW
jgi:membrane-associated phospholipid phosphatase